MNTATIKERPILFSAPMVRAIQEGRKTVTRRPIRFQPDVPVTDAIPRRNFPHGPATIDWYWRPKHGHLNGVPSAGWDFKCPYGQPGDRLWVRETWFCDHFEVMRGPYLKPDDLDIGEAREDGTLVYAADGLTPFEAEQPAWKPSIHMPRWASRILLEITDVRVERLQNISGDQAEAEGVDAAMCQQYLETSPSRFECKEAVIHGFAGLWQSTGGNWDANPRVWVVEFKQVKP
ncbi:hypothetical protein [Pseudomonas mandelii]|nr:hypothetical protein [Pseudomonas mandelii]